MTESDQHGPRAVSNLQNANLQNSLKAKYIRTKNLHGKDRTKPTERNILYCKDTIKPMYVVCLFYMYVNMFEFPNKNDMVLKPQKNHFDLVLVQYRSLAQNAV